MFSLNVSGKKPVLVCSYIGYVTEEIPVVSQEMLTITLKEDTEELDEVLVIGYGTAKKKDLTGAISRVKQKKWKQKAPRSVHLPACQCSRFIHQYVYRCSRYSRPADTRENTLSAGRLLIAEYWMVSFTTVPCRISMPLDVESIDVLKDASSVAVYAKRRMALCYYDKKGEYGRRSSLLMPIVGLV